MALLPLAGWAVDLSQCTFEVGNVTYGGEETPSLYAAYNGDRLTIITDYTWDGKFYSDATCETDKGNDVSALHAGIYYVKIVGVSPFEGEKIASFTVNPAPLTITVNNGNNLTKEFGADDPNPTTLTISSTDFKGTDSVDDLGGELAYTYTGSDVDSYDLTFSGLTSTDYEISYAALKIVITAKDLSSEEIVFTAFGDKVYKGAAYVPTYAVTYGGVDITSSTTVTVWPTDACNTTEVAAKDVDTYYVKFAFSGNYDGSKANVDNFEITKAPMSFQIGDVTKEYKGAAYVISDLDVPVTYLGFKGEDVGSTTPAGITAPTLAITGTAKDVQEGGYAITATDNGSATNYSLSPIQNGKLTITKAPLTVTADYKSKKVGQADPELTYTVSGMKNGESQDVAIDADNKPVLTRETGETVGSYAINVTGGSATGNYEITTRTPGSFTITAGAITITVLNQEKIYGQADPATLQNPVKGTHYIVTGAANESDVTVTALTRTAGETAGSYSITPVYTYDTNNYSGVTEVTGTFTIKKATLKVTVKNQTLALNDDEDDLNQEANAYTIDEVKCLKGQYGEEADEASDIFKLVFSDGTGDDETEPDMATVGTYTKAIVPELTTYGGDNYNLEYVAGDLIVSGATQLVLDRNATDLVATLTAQDGEQVDVNFINERTLKAQKWYSMVLPFDITVGQLSSALGYALVNRLNTTTNDGNVHFSLAWGTIPANEPFLVKVQGTENVDGTFANIDLNSVTFTDVTIDAPADATVTLEHDGIQFIGVYEKKTLTDGDKFYAGTESDKPYQVGSNATSLSAFASYWKAPSTARVFVEDIEGNTTVIKEVSVQTLNEMGTEGVYNLRGIKMQGAPTEKGIYIKNGKKYIVK